MARVFIGIGSNQGERLSNISGAIEHIGSLPETKIVQAAPIYETEPIGNIEQEDFLNTAVEAQTSLSPHDLLIHLKKIESLLGRVKAKHKWGPRIIDLDILFYDAQVINSDGLVIPHPQIEFRRFVLEPLAALDGNLKHPYLGLSVSELLLRLGKDSQKVEKIG